METSDREQQNGVVDAVGDLIETYRCFVNVRIVESAARGGSISIFGILILVVGVFVLLFAGLGTAWWIGDAIGIRFRTFLAIDIAGRILRFTTIVLVAHLA